MATPEHTDTPTPDVMSRLFTIRNVTLLFVGFSAATTLVSLGLSTLLARMLGKDASTVGSVGQIYESVNSVFSGLAFVALVITFRLQYEELRLQRRELENQRAAMDQSHKELQVSAEAKIREVHMRLIEMSMDDKDLAAVWPQYQGKISATRSRQNKYINLIIQHQRMLYDLGRYDRHDVIRALRYLFSNPLIREYWEARMVARQVFEAPDHMEANFDAILDEAFLDTQPPTPPKPPLVEADAEIIDLDAHRSTDSDAA